MTRATAWASLAAVAMVTGALLPYPTMAHAPPAPRTPPACAVEDGGPIPCVWQSRHRIGRQEPIAILITAVP